MTRSIQLPLTKELAGSLHMGDQVLLSGVIYTARDAAHERMTRQLQEGIPIPFDTDQFLGQLGDLIEITPREGCMQKFEQLTGGVLMLSIILTSVGLPIEGIAIIIGIDRIFDMGRSVINVLGDATCAVIVDCSERKKEAEYQKKREQELRDNVGVDPTLGKPEYMITPEDLLKKQKLNAGPKLSPEDIIKQQREAKLQQEQQAQMARKEKADGYYDDDLVIRIDLDDDNK